MTLKNRYAIVGVGYTPQGRIPDRTALSFYAESCANAIMDAGLARKDIEVYCDMPVEVSWEDIDKGFSLPKFKPLHASVHGL